MSFNIGLSGDMVTTLLMIFSTCVLSMIILILYIGRLWIKRNIFHQSFADCKIIKPFGNSYKIVHRKIVNIKEEKFNFGNKEYILDTKGAIIDNKGEPILFYLIDEPLPISFENIKNLGIKSNNKILHKVLKDDTIKKIFNPSIDILMFIICIGLTIGLIAITIYAFWQISQLQQQIIELSKQIPPPLITNPP